MNQTISVIVPVYNVAAYLSQCVESILSQEDSQLEVILIDDGSTDDSGAICDRYARQDSRVQVIHQKNGGAAAAKNAGLRAASGEYLAFVDSDDYLSPGAYRHMRSLLESEQADVVQCAFRNVYTTRQEDQIVKPGRHTYDPAEYLKLFVTDDWTCSLLWDKLYRRKLFEGIFFEEGHKIDDEYFVYQGIMNAGKIVCDDRIVYHYRQRASSVMQSPKAKRQVVLDRIDYLTKRRKAVSARFPQLKKAFDRHYTSYLIYLSRGPGNTAESLGLIQRRLNDYLREEGSTPAKLHHRPVLWLIRSLPPQRLLKLVRKDRHSADAGELFP